MNGAKVAGVAVAVLFCLALVGGCAGCAKVPAGHVGVVSTFGKVADEPLAEGLSAVAPWRSVKNVSVQTREHKESCSAPTREGLTVQIEASLLYSLEPAQAPTVYRTVGENYEEVVVFPQFRSAVRSATTKYEAKDLYTVHREQVEDDLAKAVRTALGLRGILVESVLLRDIQFPQAVKERIEAKLAAEQDAQRMQFVLQKEKQEAERKRVEAQGIADAQQIIKKDLSHEYLIYLWIEALKEGAKHNNAVIYVPTGTDGMPLFRGVDRPRGDSPAKPPEGR
jgi:prohibitin 1